MEKRPQRMGPIALKMGRTYPDLMDTAEVRNAIVYLAELIDAAPDEFTVLARFPLTSASE